MYGPFCKMWYIVGGLHLVYQHRYCLQPFSEAFCCAVAQFLLLDGLKQVAFGRCGPVSAVHHTCIHVNGSPSYSGPFGARLVHVGIAVVFSFFTEAVPPHC